MKSPNANVSKTQNANADGTPLWFRPGILLSLTASWALSRLANVVANDAIVWQVGAVCDALTIALAVTYAAVLIPYESLRSKSVAVALAVVTWLELLYLMLHYSIGFNAYNLWLLGQAAAFSVVSWFYVARPAYHRSDSLDSEHLFLVCRKPHTLQGFLISFVGFFGPYGGFSLYHNGLLYYGHYLTPRSRAIFKVSEGDVNLMYPTSKS
jgi:hypothetical protein